MNASPQFPILVRCPPKALTVLALCALLAACSGPRQASRATLSAGSPAHATHADNAAAQATSTRLDTAHLAAMHLGSVGPHPPLAAQHEPASTDAHTLWFGAEVRAYPAGVIGGLYAEAPVNAHEVVTYTLAANHTDRHDFGVHDEEDGSGYGAGVGYRHYMGEQLDGWFMGARLDVWSLKIDWKDNRGKPNRRNGTSNIWVMQPTADFGYGFRVDEHSRWNVFVAGGAEINVSTAGKSVGQGPIGLVGVSWVYGF